MDSDQAKVFVGGISWETSEEKLKEYFNAYGEVAEAVIMKDRATGRARGFGFVVFADPSVADRVVQEKHTIDGRVVEAKKAVPRDEQQSIARSNNAGFVPANQARTKKIFVGGLASTVTENDFRKYFEQFGTITDVVVMYDHGTQRPRGFGFITYDSEDAVDQVLQKTFHELNGKMVEVKRAVPKEASAGPTRNNGGGMGAGSGRGGLYGAGYGQGFNASPGGQYGARVDGRYGPSTGGAYPPYGTAGYGSGGNYSVTINGGYGASTYGGSGNFTGGGYGGASSGGGGGYGGTGGGYGSSAAVSAYSSIPGRNVWGSGGLSYGNSAGYGGNGGSSTGYGAVGTWGSSQAQGSSAGGSSNYGYGSSDGAYISSTAGYAGRSAGYGSSMGGLGSGGGGIFSDYGEVYSSSGYADTTRRSAGSDTFYSASAGSRGNKPGPYDLGGSAEVAYGGGYLRGRQSH